MPADAGIKFGQYVLVRRIARGGMAEVFLAQQRGLEGFDRRVAVKRILPHLADSPDFVRMFLGEAKLAAQLSHPNVVHIYEFGKVDHDYFIAMEFVDGVHAGQLFKQTDKLPATLIARIGADAANALHHAHELRGPTGKPYGLVHRDVSPANIMVSFDGVVKLCDFGIAKAAAVSDQLTNPGQVKGKYAYMSPEQTIAAPLDGRSDVFSLAIVLWELVSGKFIVSRGDAVDAMRAIRDGKIEPLERASPGVPPQLAKAIMWALATKREQRATAQDLAQALEAFIKQAPEIATAMQLGAWVRSRFTREGTGQESALSATGGTLGGPGTLAAPGTLSGGTVTPPPTLIGASLVTPEIPDDAETIMIGPPTSMVSAQSQRAADEPTVRAPPTVIIGSDELVAMTESIDRRTTTPMAAPRPAPNPLPPTATPSDTTLRRPSTAIVDPGTTHRKRIAISVIGLVGLAFVSFLLALAASSKSAPRDAPPPPPMVIAAAPLPPDAPPLPDAPPEPVTHDAYLEVRTIPDGGTVHVGDQSRVAPAQIIVQEGHLEVTAELPGYQPEHREVDIVQGEHQKIEIQFTQKLRAERGPGVGKLTIRTTPYSEVFEGTKKLGETPFADRELTAGVHTLTFKHPAHATVTKRITIVAGKPTKLNFSLP